MATPDYHSTTNIHKIHVSPNNDVHAMTGDARDPFSEVWHPSDTSELGSAIGKTEMLLMSNWQQFAQLHTWLQPVSSISLSCRVLELTGLQGMELSPFPSRSLSLPNLERLVLSGDQQATESVLSALSIIKPHWQGHVSDLEITAPEPLLGEGCRVVPRWEDTPETYRPVLEILILWQNACLDNLDDEEGTTSFARHLTLVLEYVVPDSQHSVSLLATHPDFENADNVKPLTFLLPYVSEVQVPVQELGQLYGLKEALRAVKPPLFPYLRTLTLNVEDERDMPTNLDSVKILVAETLQIRKDKKLPIKTLALSKNGMLIGSVKTDAGSPGHGINVADQIMEKLEELMQVDKETM
ncbi:hypothetical protein FA95DRAFT_1607039 [Auriscalpium vulgare]|uniref:Uncharacterized protein n=1 Tax=Auriscalpium vulgare TaxID=40419 RepID=A0ACB8RQ87_9AGAM|nr:hypothetical protein FA95DRAFT_1607039 [Auriscalpium vulgare]